LDLLYDVPGQTISSWRATLSGTIDLQPDHVSAYALNVEKTEPGTDYLPPSRGATRWRDRARAAQSEARAAEMYELADESLTAAGLRWYEISNWARPGRESRHNLVYWLGGAWAAVGPGAHAFDGDRTRHWNAAELAGYLESLAGGRLPPGGSEVTDERTADAERAMLRLRTRGGLTAEIAAPYRATIDWARFNGLVDIDGAAGAGSVGLTRRGRLLSNEVFERLLPAAM
jgi:oxygen-independent coproporphyrinogen-3 oxidase